MSFSFHHLTPGFSEAVLALSRTPLIKQVNETIWIFAAVETLHLLSLAVLGGAVFALNLRLLGVALQNASPREVERATRPWLWGGIVGTILTGIAMALATAGGLLGSAAFFVKMVALVAAILFSLAVSRLVRQEPTDRRGVATALAVAALALWAGSILLLASTSGIRAGALLVALAGFGLFAAFAQHYRRLYVIAVAVIVGGGLLFAELWPAARQDVAVAQTIYFAAVGGALLVALGVALAEARSRTEPAPGLHRLPAFASTLAWVSVAAAGRWIGFS
ncbi:DUF6644 family protein [Altererythrobacter sp. Root672]|uniref:DUF6644 family protein n=1 Tax=Altererythrobacter sp. Root672 TaxID=1736584 RepID=UPI0006FCE9CB|nr:DUF6644 family protein [Altererythrobacter sp. Root672]KRA84394.1 hypothetical protein ASD76_10575 [Altererythrobacter sp. Root672]